MYVRERVGEAIYVYTEEGVCVREREREREGRGSNVMDHGV